MSEETFRIVVIDDSRSVLTLLARLILTVQGCEPVPFSDPVSALEWCGQEEADLVIVDYIMPVMNGLGFIEAFRRLPDRGEIPIVMVTGSDAQTVRYMALQEGATDFLNKPIDNVEFVTRLRNLLVMRQHYKETRKRAEILRQAKEEVDRAFRELSVTHAELEKTRDNLAEAFEVIEGSIQYASRIQRSILPTLDVIEGIFSDHFIHWDPRDTVGGDIYWCRPWGEGVLFALGDCTGHGVPGAFMTLIVTGAFDRACSEVPPGNLAQLLARTHQLVQITLKQDTDQGESDDGMELGICYLTAGNSRMQYAGARFSLFVCPVEGAPLEIKGDKKGIGYRKVPFAQEFAQVDVTLTPGMRFYMSSDGLIDQVGSEVRRGFGKARFMEMIGRFAELPMADQQAIIQQELVKHQGEESRRDDVSVVGFRLRPLELREATLKMAAVEGGSMDSQVILRLREELMGEGVLFFYCGYVTEKVLSVIGETVMDKLELDNTERSVARGVFSVFVEQMQNIIRYSAENQEGEVDDRTVDLRLGMLVVGRNETGYYVASANAIVQPDVDRLRESLARIRGLDKAGLKAMHKEILKGQTPEGSKGAGVGFVDIARLASRGFEFDFLKLDDSLSYFVLKAHL
ncbi:MAG: response regulator [Magnetococcales bacterium]|nr:response regulator [Magnetococcales bacterium]